MDVKNIEMKQGIEDDIDLFKKDKYIEKTFLKNEVSNIFLDLPEEILHEILSNLNYEDRLAFSLICSGSSILKKLIEDLSKVEKKRLKQSLICGTCKWNSVHFLEGN